MACIVQKYGGSSLADVEKIRKIASMVGDVKKAGLDIAVVVSAMGKTTDQLVHTARELSPSPPRREMDMLLSTGERITMSLLCMALHELGIDSVSLTGSQSGIITNDRHNDARVIEVRPFRVQDEMAKGKVVVIGGFQGVSYKRDITTLGRGGSDTTAVALAAALKADRCEIYSDVDGVYSADPSVVKTAAHLPEISYAAMQEMSAAGAKVLNSQAVQFAKQEKIAIYARSTFSGERETIVRELPPQAFTGVQAVVSEKEIIRVRFHGRDALDNLRKSLEFLEKEQVHIKELNAVEVENHTHLSKVSFMVSPQNVYGWEGHMKDLQNMVGEGIEFDTHLSAISLIGEGLNRSNATLLETTRLLVSNDIKISGVVTTSFRISLAVARSRLKEGLRLCHERWIQG